VQDGAVFGGVDLLAGEHGLDVLLQPGLLGQLEEQLEGFVGDAIFRVVEEEAGGFSGEACAAGGVVFEELAELKGLDGLGVGGEGLPGWAGGERGYCFTHLGHLSCSLTLEHCRESEVSGKVVEGGDPSPPILFGLKSRSDWG